MSENKKMSDQEATAAASKAAEKLIKGLNEASPLLYGTPKRVNVNIGFGKSNKAKDPTVNRSTPQAASTTVIGGKKGALVGFLIGLVLVGIGYLGMQGSKLPAGYIKTTGQVISGNTASYSSATSPTIQFKAQNGKNYDFMLNSSQESPYYQGDIVKVAYNPANPQSNPKNISDKSGNIFGPLLIGLGGVLALLGLISFVKAFKS